jgi:flavin reductase (DIM6/NTAB) family NADH-FMN oxidoreductase RutF
MEFIMIDNKALFKLSYGLYVVTTNDGARDNGCIVNTVVQVADNKISVAISKANYTCETVMKTGIMNALSLSVDAPFAVFEAFGFRSGRDVNKFEDCTPKRSENGLVVLPKYINSYMSLAVEEYIDLGTHGMFICSITEADVVSDLETMTYTYYQKNVKPKPEVKKVKGYVCKICGYVHEGETLPEDFICPLCKHGASDFEPIV